MRLVDDHVTSDLVRRMVWIGQNKPNGVSFDVAFKLIEESILDDAGDYETDGWLKDLYMKPSRGLIEYGH